MFCHTLLATWNEYQTIVKEIKAIQIEIQFLAFENAWN